MIVPSPPAVAGLLAEMQEARESGEDCGMREAIEMVREHLGGPPSPLARVAAEVCALPDDNARLDAIGRLRSIANGARLETLAPVDPRAALKTIARMALAGMLACDAAPADGAKGGA